MLEDLTGNGLDGLQRALLEGSLKPVEAHGRADLSRIFPSPIRLDLGPEQAPYIPAAHVGLGLVVQLLERGHVLRSEAHSVVLDTEADDGLQRRAPWADVAEVDVVSAIAFFLAARPPTLSAGPEQSVLDGEVPTK
ncbi:hypothetical protein ABTZ78_28655 [Streptomyces bauhiniae]|uniref:hypothetical protein n=1 Tax=Streptomyces bauhiniae TaxID=2340725 RepID=UPI0033236267